MTESSYCVYCHTSPSGKRYIGVTKRKPEKRWNYGLGYADNSYFSNAIRKYGWRSFKHEILFSGLTEDEASKKEKELIKLYKTTDRSLGYNIDLGGICTGKLLSDETKRKIGDSHRGKYTDAQIESTKHRRNPHYHHTDEIKKIIGDSHRGKPLSEDHKKKLSDAHKGIKPTNLDALRESSKKKIDKYSMDGKYIETYPSIGDAANKHGVSPASVSACCRGKTKSSAGFIWKYANA